MADRKLSLLAVLTDVVHIPGTIAKNLLDAAVPACCFRGNCYSSDCLPRLSRHLVDVSAATFFSRDLAIDIITFGSHNGVSTSAAICASFPTSEKPDLC